MPGLGDWFYEWQEEQDAKTRKPMHPTWFKLCNFARLLIGLPQMATNPKKQNPELEEVIPETGDEDMIDQACQEKADSYEGENAAEDDQQPDDVKQDAVSQEKSEAHKHAVAQQKPGAGKHAKKKQPTIDDMIANIQSHETPKAKIELPDHLVPKKKVWTPDQGVTKKEAQIVGGVTPGMKPQSEQDWKGPLEIPAKTKVPPGFISGPAQHATVTDPQPYLFKLDPKLMDSDVLCPGATHFELLKVYATPIQKAQALVGVEALHSKWLYLWFDCFSGHAENTTTKRIRVYMIKHYNEFASKEIKPNKMIDLPGDIQHVILTCADTPQIEDFEFLEPYMPIKEKK
jgi:hypothetical protein